MTGETEVTEKLPESRPGRADREFLRTEAVRKVYPSRDRGGNDLTVLSDASFVAGAREFVVVIGPSGCGKSTLLSCIAGLTPYDGGRITVDGHSVDGPNPAAAVVFQHASLLPWRTVAQNVAFGLTVSRSYSRAEVADRVNRALELVGLIGFESHFPHEISGGMQQRVNLARALVVDPSLILMDEPFGALDALTKETLQDELAALFGQIDRTAVLITHDIHEAIYLADKILVMSNRPGRIVREIEVPFDRPRSRNITTTSEFEDIATELRQLLRPGGG